MQLNVINVNDVFEDVTQTRASGVVERFAERHGEGVFSQRTVRLERPDARTSAVADDSPLDPRSGTRHCSRSRIPGGSLVMQRLHGYLAAHRYEDVRAELSRAEITGELSEFYVLNFQATLAVAEGSEFASEYLEMAEAVASTPDELAVITETRAAHDLRLGNPLAAAERCLVALDHLHQTEGLWSNLLIALYRLGEVETIDATLCRLARLDDECTARIVGLLSSEPDLRDVRARPAFQRLLGCRAAG